MATIYCIDTSSLIAAWQERYPPDHFPLFWVKVEALLMERRLVAPMDVLLEIEKRSDDLHSWLKKRRMMFREVDDSMQIEVSRLLAEFPRLVGEKKLRSSADPFVIALARLDDLTLVTDEKPTGKLSRPNIPDVCIQLNLRCISLLDLIRAEKWVLG